MREEEVPVLIVVVGGHLERRGLGTALRAYRLRLRVLLRQQCLYSELAELQVRLYTKQRLAAGDELRVKRHRHVTCL